MLGRWGKGPVRWWHGEFRGCGYRITIPRQIILEVLDKVKEHLSAEDNILKGGDIHGSLKGNGRFLS
jgi:Fur family ferric uptake transcriptional regulator